VEIIELNQNKTFKMLVQGFQTET